MDDREIELIERVRAIFTAYGRMSANDYDRRTDIPDKPSRASLRKRIGSWTTICELVGDVEPKNDDTPGPNNQYLVLQNERLRREIEKLSNINQVIIENCLGSIAKCSFTPVRIPPPERIARQQEFHAMRSDDQIGEVVDSDWTQGVGSYDFDLFRERQERWCERLVTFREQDKNSLGLNKLVIYMLGDHVDGELIYKGQAYNIEFGVIDQLVQGVREYTDAILTLAGAFPKIEIFCVPGNHGRHGKKGEGHPRSNFDYLFAKMLQEALRRQSNVTVYVSESPTMIVQNGNYTFALNHFTDVKSWNGIPYYGLDRMARRLTDLYGMIINYKLGGHFHISASLNDDEILINGTIVGGSDLSINGMKIASRPSQKIFYFDQERGINRMTNIHLADKIALTADERGIYTAYSK